MRKWIVLLAVFFVVACAGDDTEKPGNGFDLGEQPEDDMGSVVSGSITFTLTNGSSETVYAGHAGGEQSCSENAFVEILGADATFQLQTPCGRNLCGEELSVECGHDCGPPSSHGHALDPGESREFVWDKMFRESRTEDGVTCQASRQASLSHYTAKFCFSDAWNEEAARFERKLCESVEFEIDDDEVNFTIEDETLPTNETAISISNTSGAPIFVRPNPRTCHGTWFQLSVEDQRLSLHETCEICNCSAERECPTCPAVECPAPTREDFELLDGEQRVFVWDHTYWPTREIGGDICEYPAFVAPDTEVSVEICFARALDEQTDFAELVDESCEELQFTTDGEQVEFEVQ